MKYPGLLPTLGLSKYKNTDLNQKKNNPYETQNETEKLLVIREREREFHQFSKIEAKANKVHQKAM